MAANLAAKGLRQELINATIKAGRSAKNRLLGMGVKTVAGSLGKAGKRLGALVTLGVSIYSVAEGVESEGGLIPSVLEEYKNNADPFGQNPVFEWQIELIKEFVRPSPPTAAGNPICEDGEHGAPNLEFK